MKVTLKLSYPHSNTHFLYHIFTQYAKPTLLEKISIFCLYPEHVKKKKTKLEYNLWENGANKYTNPTRS